MTDAIKLCITRNTHQNTRPLPRTVPLFCSASSSFSFCFVFVPLRLRQNRCFRFHTIDVSILLSNFDFDLGFRFRFSFCFTKPRRIRPLLFLFCEQNPQIWIFRAYVLRFILILMLF